MPTSFKSSASKPKLLEELEELVLRRRWILRELKRFEEKYGMDSREFYEKWVKGLLPEPEDPEVHGDFMVWQGLVEELHSTEEKLKRLLGEKG